MLAVDGWYEQIDERVRSHAVSSHFGLKVLDQLLIRGIELDASRQHRPILLELAGKTPIGRLLAQTYSFVYSSIFLFRRRPGEAITI